MSYTANWILTVSARDDEIKRLTAELKACQAERDEHRQGRDANGAELVHWMRRAQEQDQALLRAEATLAAQRAALGYIKNLLEIDAQVHPRVRLAWEEARGVPDE